MVPETNISVPPGAPVPPSWQNHRTDCLSGLMVSVHHRLVNKLSQIVLQPFLCLSPVSGYNIWTVHSQPGEEQSAVRVHGSVQLSTLLAVTKQKTATFGKILVKIKRTKLVVLKFPANLQQKNVAVLVNFSSYFSRKIQQWDFFLVRVCMSKALTLYMKVFTASQKILKFAFIRKKSDLVLCCC